MSYYQPKVKQQTASGINNEQFATGKSALQLKDNRDKSVVQRKQVIALKNWKPRSTIIQKADARPSFTADSKQSAFHWHNTMSSHSFTVDADTPDLPAHNAAMPHRMSWKDIRDNTNKYHKGKETKSDFERWTDRFIKAGEKRIEDIELSINDSETKGHKTKAKLQKELLRRAKNSQQSFITARNNYPKSASKDDKKEFLRQANSFHANVPDLGPHKGVNNPVREAGHLNLVEKPQQRGRKRERSPSPMSREVLSMSPERLSVGLAFQDDDHVITTSGVPVPLTELSKSVQKSIGKFDKKQVNSFDPNAQFGSTSTPKVKRKKLNAAKKKKKTKPKT